MSNVRPPPIVMSGSGYSHGPPNEGGSGVWVSKARGGFESLHLICIATNVIHGVCYIMQAKVLVGRCGPNL